MSAGQPCVVGLGEILWDILPEGTFLGGAPANFAFHANQLGARGQVVSAIGQDEPGDRILTALQALNVDATGVRRVSQPTGTVTVQMQDGQPHYTIHTHVAWDFLPFDDHLRQLATQADAVCFGSLAQRSPQTRSTILEFLQATSRTCWRIFDINLRQQFFDALTIDAALKVAHVLKLNHEELPIVAGLLGLPTSPDETLQALLKRYHLRLIALTRGGDGSSLYTPWRTSHHPGHPVVKLADTVGAGDSFTAALAMGLLTYRDLDAIHDRGARLASFVCTQQGATPSLPADLRAQLLN